VERDGEARRRHATFLMQALQNLKDGHLDQSLSKILTSEVEDVLATVIWGFTPEHDLMLCRHTLEEATIFAQAQDRSGYTDARQERSTA